MKQKTKELVLIKSGDYMLDMSKLVFGGIVLVLIMQIEGISSLMLLVFGIITVLLFSILGIMFIHISQKNKKKGA
ncbi:MAG: ABC transporter permease [Paludibacteraceae bacterium]|nr:ABC transporter permease [Paludibacteraceae bacterium]